MKFAYKMILGTTLIISLLFSIGGILLVQHNYTVAFDNAISTNIEEHIVERYAMEERVRSRLEAGEECTNEYIVDAAEQLAGYGSKSNYLLIYTENMVCSYSNLEDGKIGQVVNDYVKTQSSKYKVCMQDERHYMILGSKISVAHISFTIVNVYNMDSLYAERDRQIEAFVKLDILIVLVAVAAVFILSIVLTRPIKRLNKVSTEIANGAYEQRAQINTKDEIGDLATSFNTMADAIEEKIKELKLDINNREEFISDFSHEMKTPMTSIMGYAKLLTNVQCQEEEQLQYADRIYHECKRLENLSQKMLQLMEIEDNPEQLGSIEASWLGKELSEICAPLMGWVRLTIDMEPAYIRGSKELLLDLFKNLVDNGRKACKEPGEVVVKGYIEDSQYVCQVEDNGCGIPKEEISRIMEPFYMVDKSRDRKKGGSGIGLALCKKICTYHHTELKIVSTYGTGTCISFRLEVNSDEEISDSDS